ncbi:TetR/AcrR family transcriptional regulator [Pleomorphomonas oryzae]|uniref:TetR/AcrR family transcriptional regulator n=1 Tax=Pleomorphomonas oryzae TaxID=261934 RepID=UPI00041E93ED|nr:TetR/AcrR family transcriptional regulator [Pleomorphomonas oryzae]
MSIAPSPSQPPAGKRIRLSRADRLRQLIDISWRIVREEGTDALTLPRLAQAAGVAKPVVYDHFGTRNGLLAVLYRDYDLRQTAVLDTALAKSGPTLTDKAAVIASAYVACVLTQGNEIPGVLAALAGSPEMDRVKRDYQLAFIEKCRATLAPFAGERGIGNAGLWAMLGAADSLSEAAASADVTPEEAEVELSDIIVGMVDRQR